MKKAFPPIVDNNSTILLLGSMPGERSLALQQYYGHPGNQFWKLMFEVLGRPFTTDYSERIKLLLDHGIALWDVLKECERQGSSDSKIINAVANDFTAFYKQYPKIKAVFIDSATADKLYKKYVGRSGLKRYYVLPSPSARYAQMPYQDKLTAWLEILKEL